MKYNQKTILDKVAPDFCYSNHRQFFYSRQTATHTLPGNSSWQAAIPTPPWLHNSWQASTHVWGGSQTMSDKITLGQGLFVSGGKAARREASEKTKRELHQVTNRSPKLLLSTGWKALGLLASS